MGSGGSSRTRRSKRSTSAVASVVRQQHAERGRGWRRRARRTAACGARGTRRRRSGPSWRAATRRAPVRGGRRPGRERVAQDPLAALLALAPARVHEQGVPEVERDGPQHDPRVPDGAAAKRARLSGRRTACRGAGRRPDAPSRDLGLVRRPPVGGASPSRWRASPPDPGAARRPARFEVDASARGAHEQPRVARRSSRCAEAVATLATLVLAAARHVVLPSRSHDVIHTRPHFVVR